MSYLRKFFFLPCLFFSNILFSQGLSYAWAHSYGADVGASSDYVRALSCDRSGKLVLAGNFDMRYDIDPSPNEIMVESAGYQDIFFMKLDSLGSIQWVKTIGGLGTDTLITSETDSLNNIYISGTFSGTVDFDPSANAYFLTSVNLRDQFIAKYDSSGNLLWASSVVSLGGTVAYKSFICNGASSFYVGGWFSGTVDFDLTPGVNNQTATSFRDGFLAQYDAFGSLLWVKQFTATTECNFMKIKKMHSGDIIAGGIFSGTVDFDPSAGISNLVSVAKDIFFVKFNATGDLISPLKISGQGDDFFRAMDVASSDEICVTGVFSQNTNFNPYGTSLVSG